MLSIRLSRTGKKNQPSYRLIVVEKGKDPWGSCLEILGYYNPRVEAKIANLKEERLKYWLEKGAKLTATVHNLLVGQGIFSAPKVRVVKVKKAPAAEAVAAKAKEAAPPAAEPAKKEETPCYPCCLRSP